MTIVEYTDRKATLNAYPKRIISPTVPSPCCSSHMEQVGGLEREGRWVYYYKRCKICGFTVRCFLPGASEALLGKIPASDIRGTLEAIARVGASAA